MTMVCLPSFSSLWSLVKDVDHDDHDNDNDGDGDDYEDGDDGDYEDGYSALIIRTVVSG